MKRKTNKKWEKGASNGVILILTLIFVLVLGYIFSSLKSAINQNNFMESRERALTSTAIVPKEMRGNTKIVSKVGAELPMELSCEVGWYIAKCVEGVGKGEKFSRDLAHYFQFGDLEDQDIPQQISSCPAEALGKTAVSLSPEFQPVAEGTQAGIVLECEK